MTISQIAETDVVTAETEASVSDVVGRMEDDDVGSVVITENDDVRGIVTDRQIALAFRDVENPSDVQIREIMTEDPVTVDEEAGVFELIRTMRDEGIRRIPIVTDGALSGIITLDDVFVLLATELGNAADVIEQQSPRY